MRFFGEIYLRVLAWCSLLILCIAVATCKPRLNHLDRSVKNHVSQNDSTSLAGTSTTQECRITQASCLKFPDVPNMVGSFMDSDGSLGADRCLQRASDYHTTCGNPETVPTVADFLMNGVILRSRSIGNSCDIAQEHCSSGVHSSGLFVDDQGAISLQSCMQRAQDIHAACGNADDVPTVASFTQNGVVQQRAVSGNYCQISQALCPNNPTLIGTFIDGTAYAGLSPNNCIARADALHAACGNTPSVTTTATYFQNGKAVATAHSGKAFDPWQSEPYQIGAWYFASWSIWNNNLQPGFTQLKFNRWDPWGGVRDLYPNATPNTLTLPSFTPRKPAIGFYDQDDQRVMDIHIQQAASRGLTYFAFYWYWDADSGEEYYPLNTPLHRYFSSPYKDNIKFTLGPITYRGKTTLEQFKSRFVRYIVNTYIADPDYLTTADGRPIITDWAFGLSDADHSAAIQYLKDYVKAKTGKNLMVLGYTDGSSSKAKFDAMIARGDDGFQCFQQILPTAQAQSYANTVAAWSGTMNGVYKAAGSKFFMPCTIAGFDRRPWDVINPGGGFKKYNAPLTTSAFSNHLKVVKARLDKLPKSQRILTIYAWNEWGEGGIIEPSVAYGTGFIDAIRNVFKLNPRMNNPPSANLESTNYPANGVFKLKTEAQIRAVYNALLRREPTQVELASWNSTLLSSTARGAFIAQILRSPEFLNKNATELSAPSSTIDLLTQIFFQRPASDQEKSFWAPFAKPETLAQLAEFFTYSSEASARHPGLIATSGEPLPQWPPRAF